MTDTTPRIARRFAIFLILGCFIVAPLVCGYVIWFATREAIDESKEHACRVQLDRIEAALASFKQEQGKWPESLGALTIPRGRNLAFLDSHDLLDPWGRPYKYVPDGRHNSGKKPDVWSEVPQAKGKVLIGNWK